ncbi:MAG: hypothetical protein QXI09_02575 [Candidatus Aenigmatarchaeota archaeon]
MSNYEDVKAREYAIRFLNSLEEAIKSRNIEILLEEIKKIKEDREVRLFKVKAEIEKLLGNENPYCITSSLETVGSNIFYLCLTLGKEKALEIVKDRIGLLNYNHNRFIQILEEYKNLSMYFKIPIYELLSSNRNIPIQQTSKKQNINITIRGEDKHTYEVDVKKNRWIKFFRELEETRPFSILTLNRAAKEINVSPHTLLTILQNEGCFENLYIPIVTSGRVYFIYAPYYPLLQSAIRICVKQLSDKTLSRYAYIKSSDIIELLREMNLINRKIASGFTFTILNELIDDSIPSHNHLKTRRGVYHIISKKKIKNFTIKKNNENREKSLKLLAALLYSSSQSEDFEL